MVPDDVADDTEGDGAEEGAEGRRRFWRGSRGVWGGTFCIGYASPSNQRLTKNLPPSWLKIFLERSPTVVDSHRIRKSERSPLLCAPQINSPFFFFGNVRSFLPPGPRIPNHHPRLWLEYTSRTVLLLLPLPIPPSSLLPHRPVLHSVSVAPRRSLCSL